jgi:hypothetical protein
LQAAFGVLGAEAGFLTLFPGARKIDKVSLDGGVSGKGAEADGCEQDHYKLFHEAPLGICCILLF